MAVREYYGVVGTLATSVGSSMLVLQVSPNVSGAIAASGFVNNTDVSYFAISAGSNYEVVKLVAQDGDLWTVERARVGTTAKAFPYGAKVEYVVTSEGVMEQIGAISTTVAITGEGIAQVDELATNSFNVNVDAPQFTGDDHINVLGTWPNIQITYSAPDDECGGSGTSTSGDFISSIQGEGLAIAFAAGGIATVRVVPPVFTAGANISITGSWPNYTIAGTAGSGTVSSVTAGTGLTLTGSATVNPTLSITNTGVIAGTYGGVGINARGQITAVPATFDPVSSIVAGGSGEINVNRVGDAVTLTIDAAAIEVPGVVALADHTDPFDPLNASQAATPAYINMALESLVLASVGGANSYTSEADATYTNTISGSATVINILAGEKAFVYAEVTMLDGTTPANPVSYAIGIFTAAAVKVKANKITNQCQQSIGFMVEGPLNTSLAIATSAIPSGASVVSYSLVVQTF